MTTATTDKIRIALVGLGYRGMATLRRYRFIPEAQFTWLCDHNAPQIALAQKELEERGSSAVRIGDFDAICQAPDVDLVYICTNWESHASLAVQALSRGKHVALEIPAATTIADCRRIRNAVQTSRRKLFLLENCCFDPFHLGTLSLVRQGFLGELTHLEGAYIHYLGSEAATGYQGNPYPTHGIGPVAQLLGEDSFESIVSMDGKNSLNSSLLKTRSGVSVLLQFDETTPRPYSRLQTTCGTQGFVQKYPVPVVQISDEVLTGQQAEKFVLGKIETKYRQIIEKGESLSVDNMMNYIMDAMLVRDMLSMDTYPISLSDALVWSSIVEYSAISSIKNSAEKIYI